MFRQTNQLIATYYPSDDSDMREGTDGYGPIGHSNMPNAPIGAGHTCGRSLEIRCLRHKKIPLTQSKCIRSGEIPLLHDVYTASRDSVFSGINVKICPKKILNHYCLGHLLVESESHQHSMCAFAKFVCVSNICVFNETSYPSIKPSSICLTTFIYAHC